MSELRHWITLIENEYTDDDVQRRRTAMRGKPLSDTGYDYQTVAIYRALPASSGKFETMCYVTRSRKFADGHAEHMAATEGEDYHVIRGLVKAADVYEAPNPGEYLYDGPEVLGRRVFLAPAE